VRKVIVEIIRKNQYALYMALLKSIVYFSITHGFLVYDKIVRCLYFLNYFGRHDIVGIVRYHDINVLYLTGERISEKYDLYNRKAEHDEQGSGITKDLFEFLSDKYK
jgi:hypothetical protein